MSIEELIEKYLTGNLTSKEEERLKTWLQDVTNRRIFENIVADRKLTKSDVEKSKKRIYSRLSGMYNDKKKTRRFISYFSKVAAVFVLVSAIALLIFYNLNKEGLSDSNTLQIEKKALPGQKLTVKLADGTSVMLNSDSRIIFPEHFREAERKVSLEGEAFFKVAKDSLHPFVIKTNELDVRVLGTSFNVRSFTNEEDVSVAVRTGKVMVSHHLDSPTGEQVLLPNEMLVYSVKRKSFSEKRQVDNEVVFGWTDQNLVFKDENIDRILARLSRWYGMEFNVQAQLDHDREFTAHFNNPTLKEVMESISYSYQFEYEINETKVIIK